MPEAGGLPDGLQSVGERIAAIAEDWAAERVPFRWQGTVRKGCDCKGLVAGVAREAGRSEAQSFEALAGDYGRTGYERRLLNGLRRTFEEAGEIMRGDVLLLRVAGKPVHLGIATSARAMVHCHSAAGFVARGPIGRGRLHSIWRWKKEESFSDPAKEPDRVACAHVRAARSMPAGSGGV